MENKDLKIAPEIEIVRFGLWDWLKKSLDENEVDLTPPLT